MRVLPAPEDLDEARPMPSIQMEVSKPDYEYALLQSSHTPFGYWEQGEVKRESEWRKVAPNGEHLVDLDANEGFARIMTKDVEFRVICGTPRIVSTQKLWDNPEDRVPYRERILYFNPKCIEELRDACNEYLKHAKE